MENMNPESEVRSGAQFDDIAGGSQECDAS